MTRLLSFLCACFLAAAAPAADVPGTDAAYDVCDSLSFDSEKDACQRIVRNKYFDARAVRICAGLNFSSEKSECLGAIAGREFTSEREVQLCAKKSFASDKLACLKEAGGSERPLFAIAPPVTPPPTPGGVDAKEVRESITEAISQIENNRPYSASKMLQALLKKLPK